MKAYAFVALFCLTFCLGCPNDRDDTQPIAQSNEPPQDVNVQLPPEVRKQNELLRQQIEQQRSSRATRQKQQIEEEKNELIREAAREIAILQDLVEKEKHEEKMVRAFLIGRGDRPTPYISRYKQFYNENLQQLQQQTAGMPVGEVLEEVVAITRTRTTQKFEEFKALRETGNGDR